MSNPLNKLDEILYHSLRPWLEENKPAEKFAALITKVPTVKPAVTELYKFDYYRPLNPKMEYYQKIILNGAVLFCNGIAELINEDENELRQKYWYDKMLKEELPQRLTDIINIIKEKFYFIEFVNPRNVKFEGDPDKKTETFIVQFLKIAFVKVYLEVQETYKQFAKDFLLSEREVYDRFLNQALPENSFLVRTQSIENVSPSEKPVKVSAVQTSGVSLESFRFEKIDTDSDKLTDLFNYLKQNNLIAKDNPLANFKRAFSGKPISNSIVWSGNTNEFYYFVFLLHIKYELIEPLKRNIWKVACKCFIKFDGSQFDQKLLKESVKPQFTAELIESAVELVK